MIALAAVALLTCRGRAWGSIFSFTDERGVVHYSNVPVDSRYEIFLVATEAQPKQPPVPLATLLHRAEKFAHLIEAAARSNRVEPSLVRAVMVAESGCDPNATSKRGARGLMQLMPAMARQYGVRNVLDPEQNIQAGTHYLRDLLDYYQNDLERVLAAYNAGPAAVDQYGGAIPPFRETLAYVPRVLRIYQELSNRAAAH
jgi:soluble lytic murein transglycosylase-like protein